MMSIFDRFRPHPYSAGDFAHFVDERDDATRILYIKEMLSATGNAVGVSFKLPATEWDRPQVVHTHEVVPIKDLHPWEPCDDMRMEIREIVQDLCHGLSDPKLHGMVDGRMPPKDVPDGWFWTSDADLPQPLLLAAPGAGPVSEIVWRFVISLRHGPVRTIRFDLSEDEGVSFGHKSALSLERGKPVVLDHSEGSTHIPADNVAMIQAARIAL